MHPLIVIEGPDQAGKSTLAAELHRLSGGVLLHGRYLGDENVQMKYHKSMHEAIVTNLQYHTVIVDRWWMSHLAYNPIPDSKCGQTFLGLEEPLRPYYVFALDPACIAKALAHVDSDHPSYSEEKLRLVLRRYEDMETFLFTVRNRMRLTRYHFSNCPLTRLAEVAGAILRDAAK